MQTIYKGQTLRFTFQLVDEFDLPVNTLGTAVADLRIAFGGGVQSFPAVIDPVAAEIVVTVDRDITRTWRRGAYDAQVWVDYGEGQDIEAEVIYADKIEVEEGF
ncbi:MAG: hypothetical protein LPK02_06935 [Rhodobacterales bacterium]|nr:hypothetical protein [Rhodobacterales bacterium]